jgi:hypothetical protein
VDPTLLIIAIAVVTPVAIIWALAKSARLRGPATRHESKRPVGSLVTDVVPEDDPGDENDGS